MPIEREKLWRPRKFGSDSLDFAFHEIYVNAKNEMKLFKIKLNIKIVLLKVFFIKIGEFCSILICNYATFCSYFIKIIERNNLKTFKANYHLNK